MILFLNHSAPGIQLWFYLHLCMWIVLQEFPSEVALEDLGLPQSRVGVEVVPLPGSQGPWQVCRGASS